MTTVREVSVNDYADAVGDNGQLIDVREPDEFETGSLPGAINIPLSMVQFRTDEIDADRPVVLLCRSGGRSSQAAEFLAAQGYDVTNLAGGMLAVEG